MRQELEAGSDFVKIWALFCESEGFSDLKGRDDGIKFTFWKTNWIGGNPNDVMRTGSASKATRQLLDQGRGSRDGVKEGHLRVIQEMKLVHIADGLVGKEVGEGQR